MTAPLLHWVLRRFPESPRTRAKQWILAGRVRVNGVVHRKPHEPIPDPGDALELLERQVTALDCGAGWQIHPRVALLYLDAALAVVNKGPGLIAVPALDAKLSALSILADFLAGRLKARDRGAAGKSLPAVYRGLQPLPVHRLDKFTSGVYCLATNPAARQHLIDQLKARTMRREYVAYVQGRPPARQGSWRQWLELSADELRQRVVTEPGNRASDAREAVTHFEVLDEFPLAAGPGCVTKLRLRLETGRKHQIRVQAAHAGLPLVGDRAYHPGYHSRSGTLPRFAPSRLRANSPDPRGPPGTVAMIDFPRQALHAQSLTLEHPARPGTRMTWTAPLPEDLRRLEAALKAGRI